MGPSFEMRVNCVRGLSWLAVFGLITLSSNAAAYNLSNTVFDVQTGANGEISSLQLTGDAFATNYVLNATNAPGQNTSDHEWVGELMFTYRLGAGAWTTALTNQSSDVRSMQQSGDTVSVTYQDSGNAEGVRNFNLVESYSLVDDYLYWQIALTNTSSQSIEFGDIGLPLPFNEYFNGVDVIYEQRVVYHSFVGNNSSYITVKRPSGVGPFLLLVPDPTTGAGFEYMDAWTPQEHPGSAWAAGGGSPSWTNGLDVFYIHSSVIANSDRGYLPSTSLTLAAGQSQTYAFKFFNVATEDNVKGQLYSEGLIDVTAVPGMMFPTNVTAMIDLHTSETINSVTAQYPSQTTIASLGQGIAGAGHNIYQITLSKLGPNNVSVSYGSGETTTVQLYALEPLDQAIARHATFMINSMQTPRGDMKGLFDDWLMDTQSRRGATGGWGWGDDWGWTKGEFLAEKNSQTPVAAEVTALDNYLDAVWARSIDNSTYVVQDWWCPAGTSATNVNNCFYDRAYAYPHAFNTYFAMYKIANRYPNLVQYHNSADTYLMRAYNILHTLYNGHGDTGTGYMGEQTLPEIQQALSDAGHSTEAANVGSVLTHLYQAFQGNPYPYGSEYTYDNTGEEAVYTAAKASGDSTILGKVNAKTRACRGQQPTWYYYADPVTINGENFWQFQYTTALAGYCMDDWLRIYSTAPEEDERLSYAAKIANVGAINSGQIDSKSANLGTVGWTYQAMKGKETIDYATPETQHDGWWQMSGESDLGLFGAIRILSSDISVDPIFGLYGYGCDVALSSGCYAVTPKDGVFKRLNLITERMHLELDRDRYSAAVVSTSKTYAKVMLENQTPSAAHTTHLTLAGFAPGSYAVSVDGASVGSVTVASGTSSVVSLTLGTDATYTVEVGTGCASVATGSADAGSDGSGASSDASAGSNGSASGSSGSGSGGSSRDARAGSTSGSVAQSGSGDGSEGSSGSSSGAGSTSGSSPAGEVEDAGNVDASNNSAAGCGCTAVGQSSTTSSAAGIMSLVGLLLGVSRSGRPGKRRLCQRLDERAPPA